MQRYKGTVDMPDFFMDQLPEPIMKIRTAAEEETDSGPTHPSYVIEYSYPIKHYDGKLFGTSLGFDYPDDASGFPAEGSVIELHGVAVIAARVLVDNEINEETGQSVSWCDVSLALVEAS